MSDLAEIDVAAAAWVEWARRPGSDVAAKAKEQALRVLAGEHATVLHEHIAEASRAAMDPFTAVRPAIVEWLTAHQERAA